MNEKFLSRGKRLEIGQRIVTTSDEWIYGYYVYGSISTYIYSTLHNPKMVSVDPKTVGRCIGLTDKNGKMIFEGDILKRIVAKQEIIYTVDWCDNCALFVLPCVTREELETDFTVFNGYDFEIIGNIHDNPEMLSRADMPVSNDVFQPVFQPTTPENFEISPA